eukprot:8191810-Alexandrium_andersonii.AAC.1
MERAHPAGIFHLDTEGFGEVELAGVGAARGEGDCKSRQQMFIVARVYSCCTPCLPCARPALPPFCGASWGEGLGSCSPPSAGPARAPLEASSQSACEALLLGAPPPPTLSEALEPRPSASNSS